MSDFDGTWIYFWKIFEKLLKLIIHETPSSGHRIVSCGRTDGRTDVTKPIVAFLNTANAPKKNLSSYMLQVGGMSVYLDCIRLYVRFSHQLRVSNSWGLRPMFMSYLCTISTADFIVLLCRDQSENFVYATFLPYHVWPWNGTHHK